MSRKLLVRSSFYPYHVTARGNNREPFPGDPRQVWKIFDKNLLFIHENFSAQIHAFVMMPNHFHLLISTPREDLGMVMKAFMQSTTQTINQQNRRTGRIFGAPYHWSLILSVAHFDYVLKYVYRNPVKANLVLNVQDYQFSTLIKALNHRHDIVSVPLSSIEGGPFIVPNGNSVEFLNWLNQPFQIEHDKAIAKALKKTNFRAPISDWRRDRSTHNIFE